MYKVHYIALTFVLSLTAMMMPAPASAQLFVESVDVYAVDTTAKSTQVLPVGKRFDFICTGTFSFWRNAQGDSVGLLDAAFIRDIPPGEFGYPGMATTTMNGFLINGNPIASRIVPPGMSATYTYHAPVYGTGTPATLFIEDHPPLSIDRHTDNTGMLRIEIYNVSPEIAIDSSKIDFGEVELGQSRDTVIIIENIGYGPLVLSDPMIVGPDAPDFSTSIQPTYSLLPGERISFTITFAPLSIFTKCASLQLRSNDSDSPVIEIPLTGVGVTTLAAGFSNHHAMAQEENIIPVTLWENRDGSNTTSFEFDVEFDASLLLPMGIETAASLSASFQVQSSVTSPGVLHISGQNGQPLTGTGTLLRIRFLAVFDTPPHSDLLVRNLLFNAGNPRARAIDGAVDIDSLCNQYLKSVSWVGGARLAQNHPNPFNPSTTIRFHIPLASRARLEVFSAHGSRLATLVNDELAAGDHSVNFNAAGLPSGTYFYRLTTTGETTTTPQTLTRRMTLIR